MEKKRNCYIIIVGIIWGITKNKIQIINYFEHPHPESAIAQERNVSWRIWDLRLGTARILAGYAWWWALQGYLVARHCRDTWWLGAAGIPGGQALQGYLVARHCRDTWWLGTAGTLCGWALQGHLVVGALRGCLVVGHCSQAPGGGRGQQGL